MGDTQMLINSLKDTDMKD